MTGYAFHPEARLDMDEIWEYIRADDLDAADRVITEILSAIRGLVEFPNQGHKRPDLTSRPLRFLVVRTYLIAYAAEWSVYLHDPSRNVSIQIDLFRKKIGYHAGDSPKKDLYDVLGSSSNSGWSDMI